MPTKSAVHTFKKGMVKDLDRSLLSNEAYLNAENLRIVTGLGESTGALENIEGNKLINAAINAICLDGHKIIGSVLVRDTLVLFTTNETVSRIITVGFNEVTETIGTVTTIYDDSVNSGAGPLWFSVDHPIKAIGRYETPNIQKVYWTDGYNNLRYANIAANLTITGDVYTYDDYMAPEMFEFLPLFSSSKPTLSNIVGGSLYTGMVQYSYQLYRLNGATTAFSPVSDMIHIVSDSDFLFNTLNYHGDEAGVPSGKGCKLKIINGNSGYNRLRLIRIFYETLNGVPTITVSNEIQISSSPGTIEVIDTGDTVDTLTVDEFNIASTELFKCQDLATKNNRLFVANVEKTEFVLDEWDSRAVRFKSDTTATLLDSGGDRTLTALTNWDNVSTGYSLTHDGINPFNNPDNDFDSNFAFKFQSDGFTLGAEGKNIKIDFATEEFLLDTSEDNSTFYATPPTDSTDLSYKNYASPWKDGKLSWQRDEVYRLFVVFGNDRGQTADPKWICDLRMPSLHDSSYSSLAIGPIVGENQIKSTKLFPRVWFKNFPTNATWAQIHRVKRDREDKFVVTQGFAVPSTPINSVYYTDQAVRVLPIGGEIFKLVSPEINITKNITKQANDYLEYVTNFSTDYSEQKLLDPAFSPELGHLLKLRTNTLVTSAVENITAIEDAMLVSPSISPTDGVITLDSKLYSNYANRDGIKGKGSSGLAIAYSSSGTWVAENIRNAIVNYKSNVYGSQYGGHTYENRMMNVSIPCSDIIRSVSAPAWVNISYGDTFINYFDVSTILVDLAADDIFDTWSETVYVPLESSVNCDLRHDVESFHVLPVVKQGVSTYPEIAPLLRQEYAGVHVIDNGTPIQLLTFNQTKDLYLYNTVYSQQTAVQQAISASLDTTTETVFDCLIKASNVKYSGELSDSWTKFSINEEIEVDSTYGPVTTIYNFNDRLLFWQTHGFGVLAVNDRSLINPGSTSQLVLGTGGVLDRYDYISSTVGTDNKFTLIPTPNSVFWFDSTDKSVYRFTDTLTNISKNKLNQSWFNTHHISTHFVHGIYDTKYNEVIMSLYDPAGAENYTIVFSDSIDAYSGFYSFVPRLYVPYVKNYFTVRFVSNADSLYYHNSLLANRCTFYGTLYDSTIKLLFNEDYGLEKAFDNFFYDSTVYSLLEREQHTAGFTSIRCYNNLQNTGYVTLTYGDNVERKEREWSLAIPRNAVDVIYPTNVDVLDAANLDTDRLYRDRMRDKYLIVDLTYTNAAGNRFIFPYCRLEYRYSKR